MIDDHGRLLLPSTLSLSARLVHRALRYRWKLNRREIAAILPLIPRGGIGLDVGMHKGAYSWWMSRRVGPEGRVFGFEPQLRVVEPTARAFAGLRMLNVRAIHAAVSDHSGQSTIAVRRSSTHGASLDGLNETANSTNADIDHVPVPLLSLDDFVTAEKLPRVDLIKIDVEGHEMAVLRGARTLLQRFGPSLIVEIEGRHQGTGPDPVADARALLEPLGYTGEFFTERGRQPIDSFVAAKHQRYGEGYYSNNFLFTRKAAAPANR